MPRRWLVLALCAALAGCSTNIREQQARHRLYLTEPDLVRHKQIRLGMSYETVSERLGRPAFRVNQRMQNKEWSSWTYLVSAEAWQPPGDDDTGVWPSGDEVDAAVTRRPRLYLTFRDGRLVAIEDPVYHTHTVTGDLDPLDEDTVHRLRKARPGVEPGRR